MTVPPGAKQALAWARANAAADGLAARLTLAGVAARLLEDDGIEIILVGGTPVDAYVGGALGTSEALPAGWEESQDLDTVVLYPVGGAGRSRLLERWAEAGFRAVGGGGAVSHPDLPFTIDIVARHLEPDYSVEHLVTVTREGWEAWGLSPLAMAGPEDLLFDYLESAVDTRHQRDWARALAIAGAMEEHLDLSYLFSKAHWRREGAYVEALERLLRGQGLVVTEGGDG